MRIIPEDMIGRVFGVIGSSCSSHGPGSILGA